MKQQENECSNEQVVVGELTQLSATLPIVFCFYVRFRSELFFSYLRNMLFSAHCTAGDSVSVWPCPRCFSSRASATPIATSVRQQQAADFTADRRRERGKDSARAPRRHARTRALLPKLEGRVGLPICLPTFLPTFPCPYCPWRSSNHLCRRLVSRVPPPSFLGASF